MNSLSAVVIWNISRYNLRVFYDWMQELDINYVGDCDLNHLATSRIWKGFRLLGKTELKWKDIYN
ncbi:MAG: hypothetical protein K2N81_07730, partial [Acetatifactor sp.]|nr:hypothetical protein [Acetatifactor sp.]